MYDNKRLKDMLHSVLAERFEHD